MANLYIENFEEKALSTTTITPDVWLRYVDDTLTVLQKYDVSEFTEHINNIDKNIKFTIEEPENKAIAFLDTKVTVKNDGSTKIQVYRKPTHTDQYLNWDSNHPLEHKRSMIRTLLGRADQVVSEEQDEKEKNMWKSCWNVMVIRTGPWRYHQKKRQKKTWTSLRKKENTHQVLAFRTYKVYQNSLSEFSRNMVCLRTTNQQTKRDTSETGQNTHGITIGVGIPTEMWQLWQNIHWGNEQKPGDKVQRTHSKPTA